MHALCIATLISMAGAGCGSLPPAPGDVGYTPTQERSYPPYSYEQAQLAALNERAQQGDSEAQSELAYALVASCESTKDTIPRTKLSQATLEKSEKIVLCRRQLNEAGNWFRVLFDNPQYASRAAAAKALAKIHRLQSDLDYLEFFNDWAKDNSRFWQFNKNRQAELVWLRTASDLGDFGSTQDLAVELLEGSGVGESTQAARTEAINLYQQIYEWKFGKELAEKELRQLGVIPDPATRVPAVQSLTVRVIPQEVAAGEKISAVWQCLVQGSGEIAVKSEEVIMSEAVPGGYESESEIIQTLSRKTAGKMLGAEDITVPKDTKPGRYVYRVNVEARGYSEQGEDVFYVTSP